MKIAFFSTKSFDRIYFDALNKQHEIEYFEAPLNENTANLTVGAACVCAFVSDELNKKVIDHLAKNGVQLIALRSAGFNHVDLAAARVHNMKIVRVPAYSPEAVAEHAVALILSLNRKIHKAYNRVRDGNFSLEKLIGFDLNEKTVGVVGTGKIGIAFGKIMQGFGCKVVGYDPYPSQAAQAIGIEYLSLDDLLASSDVVSLHCPLTPQTFHLINKSRLTQMKKGAMLINTSRGALVDTLATVEALKNEQLGYLGIDVYEQEENLFFKDLSDEIIRDDVIARLMTFPNVLITSHQGFLTKEALSQIAQITLDNITQFESGNILTNEVKMI